MHARKDGWNDSEAPDEGAIVRALVSDERGEYVLPFPVLFGDDDWHNAVTGETLSEDVFVEGWMPWTSQLASSSRAC